MDFEYTYLLLMVPAETALLCAHAYRRWQVSLLPGDTLLGVCAMLHTENDA